MFWGMKLSRRLTSSRHSCSEAMAKCATPLLVAWLLAPPSSSCVTDSPVTALMTSGPVMYICPVPSTINTKSVRAGE